MLCDHAMVDAIEPILPTAEDEVDVGTNPSATSEAQLLAVE